MILIEFLLAPTVPSDPRPKKIARTQSSGSMSKSESTGSDVCVQSSTMPTVKWFFGAAAVGSARKGGTVAAYSGRGDLLRAEAIAAADEHGIGRCACLAQRRDDVEVERFADAAGLLGAVEHRDRPHAGRQGGDEIGDREGPEEMHVQN